LPLKAFFEAPVVRGAQLSPDGRRLAMIRSSAHGDALSVVDLTSRNETVVLTAAEGAHFGWVRWKGADRILAGQAVDRHARERDAADESPGMRADETVVAVDADGGHMLLLWKGERPRAGQPATPRLADPQPADPVHILTIAANAKGGAGLWRMDVRTGDRTLISAQAEEDGDRQPLNALTVREAKAAKAADLRWARGKVAPQGLAILGPAANPDQVYALGHSDEGVTVRVYDFRKQAMSEPVWRPSKSDVAEIVYGERDKDLAGVCGSAEVYGCEFRDAGLQADYEAAVKKLGRDHSLTPVSMSQDGRWWLFGVSAPSERGAYWLMDRDTKALTLVADRYPELPSDKLGRREPYVFTARDGTKVPGYVTRPPGSAAAKDLPLLVMPHGGPEARDSLNYDRWAQFFATRGYLVFQPNFRGSTGYGAAWVQAGYGQWGGLMQDDLTDGVKSLIASGQADAGRICVMGASYGGYAALYGGATQPELYKCVVSWAGVSDLRGLVQAEKKAHGPKSERYLYAVHAIGDPAADGARLTSVSPITHAADYQPPVMLLHGSRDDAVPVEQSERMAAALKAAGHEVSLTIVPEGHVDWSHEHESAALAQIAAFLDRNIGTAPSAGGATAAR
jgi:dipeptidyl aminopeptidase/acylaminoacyl peptidase